ncbi:hypothetical protein HELRODRAFT_152823, partial [Helobdella robusta]|uniref:Uncharacterized protein n=1 Tax=Helobdella robusta TaxID=6412 RepID=T1EKX3_HELRO
MKKTSSHPLHASIYSSMDTWLEGIRKVQARRKEEIVSTANRNNSGGSRFQEEKDNMALSSAIEELLGQTRRVRTSLWCAFQMCLFASSSPA